MEEEEEGRALGAEPSNPKEGQNRPKTPLLLSGDLVVVVEPPEGDRSSEARQESCRCVVRSRSRRRCWRWRSRGWRAGCPGRRRWWTSRSRWRRRPCPPCRSRSAG